MTRRRQQLGLGLISAVFLLVVVALLTVAVARSVRSSTAIRNLDLLGSRALLVAESGAQVGVRNALQAGSCGTQQIDFSSLGHNNCNAAISCVAVNAAGQQMFRIESLGTCSASADLTVQRRVQALVK